MLTTLQRHDTVRPVTDDEARWILRGQRIRERREGHGITQEELGEKIGRSRDAVMDAEAARSKAGIERIEKWLDDYEAEIGDDVEERLVEVNLRHHGLSYVVKGSVRDLEAMEESALRVAKRLGLPSSTETD